MPNIKPEEMNRAARFIYTREGEFCLVAASCGLLWALAAELFAKLALFVSKTLYPFTYPFFHTPLHEFLPTVGHSPSFAANLIFGAFFGYALYFFEKNIFYRRIPKPIRAMFGSIAACVIVFISGLIAFADDSYGLGLLSFLFLSAEPDQLLHLLGYYFFAVLCITSFCDTIRRQVFLLP